MIVSYSFWAIITKTIIRFYYDLKTPLLIGLSQYLHDIILSGQVERLSSNVERDNGESWNLITLDYGLKGTENVCQN